MQVGTTRGGGVGVVHIKLCSKFQISSFVDNILYKRIKCASRKPLAVLLQGLCPTYCQIHGLHS